MLNLYALYALLSGDYKKAFMGIFKMILTAKNEIVFSLIKSKDIVLSLSKFIRYLLI